MLTVLLVRTRILSGTKLKFSKPTRGQTLYCIATTLAKFFATFSVANPNAGAVCVVLRNVTTTCERIRMEVIRQKTGPGTARRTSQGDKSFCQFKRIKVGWEEHENTEGLVNKDLSERLSFLILRHIVVEIPTNRK